MSDNDAVMFLLVICSILAILASVISVLLLTWFCCGCRGRHHLYWNCGREPDRVIRLLSTLPYQERVAELINDPSKQNIYYSWGRSSPYLCLGCNNLPHREHAPRFYYVRLYEPVARQLPGYPDFYHPILPDPSTSKDGVTIDL